jgi:signal transduction histidine kinase/CheY-like chemotaxis protein
MHLSESIHELDAIAWSHRFGDRPLAGEVALAILRQAARGSVDEAVGHFHRAWWALVPAHPDLLPELARAEALFAENECVAGVADCLALRAQVAWSAGDALESARLARQALALTEHHQASVERPLAQYAVFNMLALSEWDLGDFDNALRSFARALQMAEKSGGAGVQAQAHGNLGGFHLDLFNLEAAAAHAQRGVQLIAHIPQSSMWLSCAVNHMLALSVLGKHAEACTVAAQLLAQESHFPTPKRKAYQTKLAGVFFQAGDVARARHHLQLANALGGVTTTTEWLTISAQLLNHDGDPAAARALIEGRILGESEGPYADVPQDLLHLYQTATQSCKALGDFEAALKYQELAFARHEELVGRAARAKRIAIEIEQQVERTARQRDEALMRQRVAELEQQRLGEVNASLEQANQARSRFLVMASHDIRQPLHALALYLAALREEAQGSVTQDLVQKANRTVDSLTLMFDELLDLSRLEAGAISPDRKVFDLRKLVLRLAEEYATRAKPGLEVAIRLPRKTLRIGTLTDALLIERVLRNLIDNAVKYTPQGCVLIAVRQRQSAWRIEVRDNGPGIAPENQARIFEDFFQVESRQSTQGLGLGLAIVYRLCVLLGHPLELLTAVGKGSSFCVELPRRLLPGARRSALLQSDSPLRIVLMDDDVDVRDSMRALLTQWGHDASAGRNAEELIAESRDTRGPDAIIADLRLDQGLDGMTEIMRLRRYWQREIPALVVTGESDPMQLRALHTAGYAWLAKPVRLVRLRGWLATVKPQS